MSKKNKVEQSIFLHGITRMLKWIPTLFITFLLIAFALFQIPKIQTKILNETSLFIAQNTSFRLSIGHANLTWYDEFLLEDVHLYQADNDSTLIKVDNLTIDFGLINYLVTQEITGDQLKLNSPHVHIIKQNDSTDMNINLFLSEINSILHSSKKKQKSKIEIDIIQIQNGIFSYNQIDKDSILDKKDYYHFRFNNLNSELKEFIFVDDSIGFQIDSLTAKDPESDLDLKHLNGNFHLTKKRLSLTEFELRTNQSVLGDSVVLYFNHPRLLKHMMDSVTFDARMSNSHFDIKDLSYFIPQKKKITKSFQISGHFIGGLRRFNVSQLNFQYGNSRIKGDGYVNGLPYLNETFIDFEFDHSTIEPEDLTDIVNPTIYEKLDRLGPFNLNGSFSGFPSNFVTNGYLKSKHGVISSDINFKIDNKRMAQYNGEINLKQFAINEVFDGLSNISNITLQGSIKGTGLKINNANFDLNANIDSIQYSNYKISNISTIGHFEKQFLNAAFTINDPKLKFNGDVEVDIRSDQNRFRIDAQVDTVDLYLLNLAEAPFLVSSKVNIDMKGLKIDEMKGFITLHNNLIHYNNNTLKIDSVNLISSLIGDIREIDLSTDEVSANLIGRFNNKDLSTSINQLYQEIRLNLENDSSKINNYYSRKNTEDLSALNAKLKIKLRDVNPYVQAFYPNISISKNIDIESNFIRDSISTMSFYAHFDSIKVNKLQFQQTSIDLNIAKNFFDKDQLSTLTIESFNQSWNENIDSENLLTEIIWNKDLMSVWCSINQPEFNNNVSISSDIHFNTDNTLVHMLPAQLELMDHQWTWDKDNEIKLNKQKIHFSNFGISNNNQKIEANGTYGNGTNEIVRIDLKELELKNIEKLVSTNLEGNIDGSLKIQRSSNKNLFSGRFSAHAIKVKDFLVGNIFFNSEWDEKNEDFEIELDLVRNGEKKMEASGSFYPFLEENQFDVNSYFYNADLEIAAPLIQKNFSNVSGEISGKLELTGTIDSPMLGGAISIKNGHTKVNYLNTTYTFSGDIQLHNNFLSTQNLNIIDIEGHSALMTGNVEIVDRSTIRLNLDTRIDNFKVLNTNSIDNNLYYGTAYATGNVSFRGTNQDFQVNASAKSDKGSKLFLPINQNDNFKGDQKDYIQFVNLTKTKEEEIDSLVLIQNALSKIKGIRMNLDLELTSDTYIEMIFDIKSGDIIRGRGNGNLNLLINTDGDFSMLGDYSIEEGGYNFTLYNIINKEFEIKKGSNISWYGDPYGAILNIEANYNQLTSLYPILNNLTESQQSAVELRKKYPTRVDLKLTENLLTPNITFDINIDDYPRQLSINNNTEGNSETYALEDQVIAFKNKIRNNEQEMNRQVFSLLILRKFSSEDNFEINSATLGTSISEFVSNQLSYWATQVDENLEIDVDLTSLDEDAFNTFQLRMSYTFMDGRLKVTRGGGIPNEQTSDNIYSYIGDWSVEYLLTEDGRFRAKVYSRADLNPIEQQTNPNSVETGFSLQFVRSFDQFSEIVRDNRKKNMPKNSDQTLE
ncbi:MAG: translocation/assembly module TamB domain-containing protein [Reichenbachiella sp.]